MEPDEGATSDDASSDGGESATAGPHVLYLSFSGAALAWGPVNDAPSNVSAISESHRATVVPPFMEDLVVTSEYPTRESVIAAIAELVAEAFAPFDVQVVTERPGSGAFTMIVIGGTPEDVDYMSSSDVAGGTATTACDSTRDRDVGYAMTDGLLRDFRFSGWSFVRAIGHIVAHEAGHDYGLLHDDTDGATIMGPVSDSLAWGAGPVVAGPSGRTCGRSTQDDVVVLEHNLGPHRARVAVPTPPDREGPTVTDVVPADGATIAPDTAPCLRADDPSGIAFAMLQIYTVMPGLGPWLLAQHVAMEPPFRFPPPPTNGDVLLRFVTVDRWDNLTERRVNATIAPGAPSIACAE